MTCCLRVQFRNVYLRNSDNGTMRRTCCSLTPQTRRTRSCCTSSQQFLYPVSSVSIYAIGAERMPATRPICHGQIPFPPITTIPATLRFSSSSTVSSRLSQLRSRRTCETQFKMGLWTHICMLLASRGTCTFFFCSRCVCGFNTDAYRAQIMLHDHHFRLDSPTDQSAVVVYKAAHAILDLVYNISSTSYDVSLLDQLALV